MIITDKKVAYIKIPKTGSTTVAKVIWDHYEADRLAPPKTLVNLNFVQNMPKAYGWHVSFDRISAYLGGTISDYQIFTVIREPVARLVSAYRWASQKQPEHPLMQSFDDFIAAVARNDDMLPNQAALHAKPQVWWLKNTAGEIAPEVQIFTLEHLALSNAFFMTHLGIEPAFQRVNKSVKKNITVATKTQSTIAGLYAEDLALYRATADQFGRLG